MQQLPILNRTGAWPNDRTISSELTHTKMILNFVFVGGHYIYTEVSGRQPNQKARIYSSVVSPSSANQVSCLTFYYHMKGASIGALNLYLTNNPNNRRLSNPTWQRKGQQGNSWQKAQVTVRRSSRYYVSHWQAIYLILHKSHTLNVLEVPFVFFGITVNMVISLRENYLKS